MYTEPDGRECADDAGAITDVRVLRTGLLAGCVAGTNLSASGGGNGRCGRARGWVGGHARAGWGAGGTRHEGDTSYRYAQSVAVSVEGSAAALQLRAGTPPLI